MLGLKFDHFFQPSKVEFWRSLGQKIGRNLSGKFPQGFSEASFCDVMCVCVCVYVFFLGGTFAMFFEFMNVYECSLLMIVSHYFSKKFGSEPPR